MVSQDSSDNGRPMEILLLCDRPQSIAATLFHHLDGLVRYSRHRVRQMPMLGFLTPECDLDRFDVVVIHWSLIACSPNFIDDAAREKIRNCRAMKAMFIQDEYRFIHKTWWAIRDLGIKVLFTCVPESEIEKVYPSSELPGVHKVNVMTGYVDESLLGVAVPAYQDRPIDVGYRARKLPYWMGELAREKSRISERFAEEAPRYGLTVDVSCREEDRIYGEDWNVFIKSCKAMLGVESGVSVFDFDGSIQTRLEALELANPSMTFEEMRDAHLKDLDGLIRLNQISPRCFETAALRTLMVLYEGEYSGRLQPWRHFVPLKKDHSNMDEVVAIVRDPARAQAIIDAAYHEVACNPENSFKAAVRDFDAVLEANFKTFPARSITPYTEAEYNKVLGQMQAIYRHRLRVRAFKEMVHKFIFRFLMGSASEKSRKRVLGYIRWILRRGNTGH